MSRAFLAMVLSGVCAIGCGRTPSQAKAPPVAASATRPTPAAPAQPEAERAPEMAVVSAQPDASAEPASPRRTPSAPPLPTAPPERLAEVQRLLRAVPDFTAEAIPAAARPLLVELRQSSLRLVQQQVADVAAVEGGWLARATDERIERSIEAAAAAAGVHVAGPGAEIQENGLWYASVTRSRRNPRILVIGFYYAVPCGTDGGYLVYDLGSAPSRLLLTLASPDADSIEPMFWNLAFAVPPPGNREDFFFVATRMTPWCQSAQRQLQLMALRPTGDPESPDVLIDITVGQHLLKPLRLDVTRRSIVLETDDGMAPVTRRWTVADGRATAIGR